MYVNIYVQWHIVNSQQMLAISAITTSLRTHMAIKTTGKQCRPKQCPSLTMNLQRDLSNVCASEPSRSWATQRGKPVVSTSKMFPFVPRVSYCN